MKSKLFLIMLSVVVLSLVFTSGCKKFDINGTWTLSYTYSSAAKGPSEDGDISNLRAVTYTNTVTFVGTRETGTWTCSTNSSLGGTYSVDGKNVSFLDNIAQVFTYTGVASDDFNTVTGTRVGPNPGPFTLVR